MTKPLTLSGHFYLILMLTVISAVAQEPPRSLVLDSPIERELSGGQIHAYTIKLTAGELLRVLNDPATTVAPVSIEESDSASGSTTSKAPTYFRVVDEHVIINASDWVKARANNDVTAFARQQPMLAEIAKAKGIVLDCRYNDVSHQTQPRRM